MFQTHPSFLLDCDRSEGIGRMAAAIVVVCENELKWPSGWELQSSPGKQGYDVVGYKYYNIERAAADPKESNL